MQRSGRQESRVQDIPYVMHSRWELANAIVAVWAEQIIRPAWEEGKGGDHSGVREVVRGIRRICDDGLLTGGQDETVSLIRDASFAATVATLLMIQSTTTATATMYVVCRA